MIYRDIKPANILLDKRETGLNSIGEPVLTDFGIAKLIDTASGTVSGVWLVHLCTFRRNRLRGSLATNVAIFIRGGDPVRNLFRRAAFSRGERDCDQVATYPFIAATAVVAECEYLVRTGTGYSTSHG